MVFDFVDSLKKSNSFNIIVKTSQRKTSVEFVNESIIVSVKAKPENNKANDEIERYLSKISGKSAKIIKGKTSVKKVIKLN